MTSREARELPDIDLLFHTESVTSLDSQTSGPVTRRLQKLRVRAIAIGIDLTDLGYEDGATVDGQFLQDTLDDDNIVDPRIHCRPTGRSPVNFP